MPSHRPLVRSYVTLVALAASALAVIVPPAGPSYADFATDCSAPTRTLQGDRTDSFSVQDGETLRLTGGRFSGGVDAFPAGSTLCVDGSAELEPTYMNNAAGALVVAADGEVDLAGVAVATGFSLENEGSFRASGLNVNGASTFHNYAGGRLVLEGGFSPGNGAFLNEGTMRISGDANLNGPVTLTNARVLRVDGTMTVNGGFSNIGLARVGGQLTVNGSAAFDNACTLAVRTDLSNDAPAATSEGVTVAGGAFRNNGTWTQSTTGLLYAQSLTNDGGVAGFGRYRFAGNTATQGSFAGESASQPILVDDRTPPTPPQIFDTQSGTVTNVVAGNIPPPGTGVYPLPGCSGVAPPADESADVEAAKSAPAQVAAGGSVTFTITVTNHGADPAQDVVLSDDLPDNLVGPVAASDGGTVGADTVTWNLGTLAVDESRTLTVTGTAPDDGTLVNTVASTSSTDDPDPTNNDGSAEAATSTTDVEPPAPVNNPPVAPDVEDTTISRVPVAGSVTATDPDEGQRLRYSRVSKPANGNAAVAAGGGLAYLPTSGFTGVDQFEYTTCDNGTPSLCDDGTVTVTTFPVARQDGATTDEDTPVTIPVSANDTGIAPIASTSGGPANGSVTIDADGTITYTPNPGFTGDDTFTYTICSPTAPDVCASAPVTVTVLPVNHPPTLPDEHLVTEVNVSVDGRVTGSDPDGDALTYRHGTKPRHGRDVVRRDGRLVYWPRGGYAGHDRFHVTVCDDGDPALCASDTVTVDVYPTAMFDRVETTVNKPVTIKVLRNDEGTHRPTALRREPKHGTATARDSAFVYQPNRGFTGKDRFRYELCTPGARPLCDTTWVVVTVRPTGGGGGGGGAPS